MFQVVTGDDVDRQKADAGTMTTGDAMNPYDNTVITADYIKEQVAAGTMRPILYAVAVRRKPEGRQSRPGPLMFRAPSDADHQALGAAKVRLDQMRATWETEGVLPTEAFPPPIPKHHIRPWGFNSWQDFFTDRQLLTHVTFVRLYRELAVRIQRELPPDRAEAVLVLIGLMHGKMLDYNSRHSAWNVNQQTVQHMFESHGFGFKSTFAEKMTPGPLLQWASRQVLKAYRVSAELIEATRPSGVPIDVETTQGNAADLVSVKDRSIACLCIDPPYYENVMYGELADYFYVWHKRTIGSVRPEWFPTVLSDQENEAVANIGRFAQFGDRRTALADADYEAKMTAIFAECGRVLRDDGVLTVMFTHKKSTAWDKLGMALIAAGFTVETSWPVNTEFEYSKHQANLAAASSTVMLVCRKREARGEYARSVYLEDIEADIRQTAVRAYSDFRAAGIDGVDLLLSTYGPTLSVVSRNWPVYASGADEESGRARLLRPEEALAIARAEITRVQRARLIGAPVQFDPLTDFTLTFWDTVRASGTPYDEARRLALAVGLELDQLTKAKIVRKQGGVIRLLEPKERVLSSQSDAAAAGVRATATSFGSLIDALHTVCYVAEEDTLQRARSLMDTAGLTGDRQFKALLQAMVRAVPRSTTVKGGDFDQPLAATLDRLCSAFFPEIEMPPIQEDDLAGAQGDLFMQGDM